METDTDKPKGFEEVFGQEIKSIRDRRSAAGEPSGDLSIIKGNLVGLALSGGGVRSATFCLGFLQAMRKTKLLHKVDYLSTVSGGGFVGAWWSAWLSRNRVELRKLDPSGGFTVDEIRDLPRLLHTLKTRKNPLTEYIRDASDPINLLVEKYDATDSNRIAGEQHEEAHEELVYEINRLIGYGDRKDDQEGNRKVDRGILRCILGDKLLRDLIARDSELMQSIRGLLREKKLRDHTNNPIEIERIESEQVLRFLEEAIDGSGQHQENPAVLNDLVVLQSAQPEDSPQNSIEKLEDVEVRWLNRAFLEASFPCEIGRDLFPPPEKTALERVERQELDAGRLSDTSSAGRDPIHHLRLYSNYLTPRRGILSGDTWRVITAVARNLGITWFIMLPALVALVLFGQLYFVLQPNPIGTFVNPNPKNTLRDSMDYNLARLDTHEHYKNLEVLTLLEQQEAFNSDAVRNMEEIGKAINFEHEVGELRGRLHRLRREGRLSEDDKKLLKVVKNVEGGPNVYKDDAGSIDPTDNNAPSGGQGNADGATRAVPDLKTYLRQRNDPRLLVLAAILKEADPTTLAMLNGLRGANSSLAEAARIKQGADEQARLVIKEKAREIAMTARLESVGLGLLPFAFWIIALGIIYLFLTMVPERSETEQRRDSRALSNSLRGISRFSETLVVLLSVCVAGLTLYCLFLVYQSSKKGLQNEDEKKIETPLVSQASASVSQETLAPAQSEPEKVSFGSALVRNVKGFCLRKLDTAIHTTCGLNRTVFVLVSVWVVFSLASSRRKDKSTAVGHRSWENWCNYVNLAQTRLIVWFTVAAVVLLISGFGHELFNESSYKFAGKDALVGAIGFVAVAAAIVGVVYIVYWVRPKGGGDRREISLSPRITRLIVAVTPTLAIIVLAIAISWIAHELIAGIYDAIKPASYGHPRPKPLAALAYLTVGAYCGVFISLVYAMFETKELSRNLAYGTAATWALLAVGFFLGRHSFELIQSDHPERRWLSWACLAYVLFWLSVICSKFRKGDKFELSRARLGIDRHATWLIGFSGVVLLVYLGFSFVPYQANSGVVELDLDYRNARALFGLIATTASFIIGLGWMADPNAYSMHLFYKIRLVRAYLGASNHKRGEKRREITQQDSNDDVLLTNLSNCQKGGPYHLINTTLNLTAGRDLATAQRSADCFLLSEKFCGSTKTKYRKTSEYMKGRLSLGAAAAVSGAAASPNMGSRTPTAALAMLMTILNVRLGYWVSNPNWSNWRSPRARLWPFYLFREFLSRTNEVSSYCYLTDGGHFDNTGAYSLVQRGCHYIVLADCGADPRFSYNDLGDLIRRCRIDFGAEIDLDISPPEKGTRKDIHYKVGTIIYNAEYIKRIRGLDRKPKRNELEATIILIKPSIPEGKALPDVRQYQMANRFFPQQSTLDQWFDEAQFESYRRLGDSCATIPVSRLSEKLASSQQAQLPFTSTDSASVIRTGAA